MAVAFFRANELPRWPAALAVAAVMATVLGFALAGPGEGGPVGEVGPALLYLTMAAYGFVLATNPLGSASTRAAETAPVGSREQRGTPVGA
jgi:hypothetical protein